MNGKKTGMIKANASASGDGLSKDPGDGPKRVVIVGGGYAGLFAARRASRGARPLAGLVCFVAMIVVTRNGNLPINARIDELPTEEASLEEFGELRERWTRLHAVRNVLNVAGFVFASLGTLSEPRERKAP